MHTLVSVLWCSLCCQRIPFKEHILFTALDIPPPISSHMQKLTEKVSQTIIELNKKDMSDNCRTATTMASHKNPKHISVSRDGRYNARGCKSSYKPGQSSSISAYTVAMENVTKEKYWACRGKQIMLDWGLATEPWF